MCPQIWDLDDHSPSIKTLTNSMMQTALPLTVLNMATPETCSLSFPPLRQAPGCCAGEDEDSACTEERGGYKR